MRIEKKPAEAHTAETNNKTKEPVWRHLLLAWEPGIEKREEK
jgi:hypothetical protein